MSSSLNGGTYPPLGVITANDHGSYVVIATWILVCISVIFVGVRLVLRSWVARHFGSDNLLAVIALVFAITESVVVQISVNDGLGKHTSSLSSEDVSSFYKTMFAARLLSIVVFVLSKLSLIAVFGYITSVTKMGIVLLAFTAFIVVWGITNLLSSAFQCGGAIPMRAADQRCVNETYLLMVHGVINIATDVFIVVLPVFMVWNVQISRHKKLVVCSMFWVRIAVAITAGIQLSTIATYLHSDDPTWDALYPTLWNQVTVHLSIITACVPFLKPFFDSMQSSLVDSGIPRNYSSKLVIELRPWGSSPRHSSNRSSRLQPTRQNLGAGLLSKTRTEVQGGGNGEGDSMKGLTDDVIHEQRDVDVSVAVRAEGESQADTASQNHD